MNRMLFICADGKKTALVGAVRLFWITANRDGYTNIEKLKSVSPMWETCDAKPLHRRYSVIEKHLDTSQTILE